MKKIIITVLAIVSFVQTSNAQDKVASQLYNNKGKKIKYQKMIKGLADSDMVFFGEYHNNPISHWMQIEMAMSFFELKGDKLFFGGEMFESGNQLVMNEYLAGLYPEKKMLPEMTQMWKNYKTDYKPLMEFAKENDLRFIASNIPRRYAAMINKKGMDALKELSPEALKLIGPDLEKYFDPTVKAYVEMKDMMGEHVPPNMLNIQTAQAAKDATMAHFSLVNFKKGDLYFHFNGSYHSNNNQGIIWWVNKIQPGLNIKSIATVMASEWDEMTKEEKAEIADYIIVVADLMTETNR
ncbi:MAG: hypothetical protein COB73_07685 [Flavobacteriaceae bacterium]|nr:MAG: hypothetical protein COB73_07685 [Flavobacteriaceae bacterium]